MNLTVTGRNFEITDAIKKNLKKRIAKTGDRLYDNGQHSFLFLCGLKSPHG